MKKLKFLLLVIAMLLPFRGVMASVGMFCHLGSSQVIGAIVQPHHHDVVPTVDHAHASTEIGHAHVTVDTLAHPLVVNTVAVGDDTSPQQADTCAYCAASCAIPPIAPAALTLHAPMPSDAWQFPALPVPRSSFDPSGLERPPRTI